MGMTMAWDRLMEDDIAPNSPTPLPRPRHALVLAPHPDDEILGCGGTLHLWVQSGIPVSVVILTDGARCHDGSEAVVFARREESKAAARVIGYGEPEFWDFSDRELRYGEGLVRRLVEKIQQCEADWILAPALSERHPDHQAVALAAAEAIRRLQGERELMFYEVSAPLQPNVFMDITTVEEIKRQAMVCFASQEALHPYSERIQGLNRYRAYSLGSACRAAEAFYRIHASALGNGLKAVRQTWQEQRAAASGALDPREIPLVSVIVRSMDRSTLPEALQSLADQTYPNIQLIVVNAKGGCHSPPYPVRPYWDWVLVEDGEPLSRSQAANLGLQHARGRWILFLDDDDVLLPDHVHRLARALIDNPSFLAAYTGVRVVDGSEAYLFDYDQPYCFERLLAANYIPNLAVLFDRRLVTEHGCCFDETLPVLEDWDFLLQMARHTAFAYVPGVSAVYRYGLGHSGLSRGRQEALYQQYRRVVMEKWLGQVGLDVVDRALDMLARDLEMMRSEMKAVRGELDESRRQLEETRRQLEETRREMSDATGRYEAALAQELCKRMQREAIMEQLKAVAANLQRDLEDLKNHYAPLEARLRSIESSRIWKATYPVRIGLHQIKKILGLV